MGIAELIAELEPEAAALITLLVQHLHRTKQAAPPLVAPSSQQTPEIPQIPNAKA